MFQDKDLHLLLSFWAVEHIRIHGTGKEANSRSFRSLLLFCISKPLPMGNCSCGTCDGQSWWAHWYSSFFPFTMTAAVLALHCESRVHCADGALPSTPTDQRHTEIKNSNILAWPNTHKRHSQRTSLIFSIRSHPA